MTIDRAAPAVWFLDVFLDGETLRVCNEFEAITFDGNTYTPLGDRMNPPDDVNTTRDLKSDKVSISFDSSRQTDNTDFLGKVLDSEWKRRKVRLRYAVGAAGYDFSDPFIVADNLGKIETLKDSLETGEAAEMEMEFESGALIFLERKNQTRSPANQKAAFSGDKFFDFASKLNGAVLPWNTKRARNGRTEIEYTIDGVAGRALLIGAGITNGSFVYGATHGQQRKYWSQVYALADHRCHALKKLWINGENVLAGVTLSHGVRTALSAFASGGTRLWVTWYDGREDQTADSYLTSETTGQALAWTSSHRGRGVSYCIVTHLWDSDNAKDFDYKFEIEGAYIYNERKDTTSGGTGTHRLNDPATWEYSTNAADALRHYLLGIRSQSGSSHSWFGVGADADFLDDHATYAAQANECDTTVALKLGGTQKKYESNGWISASDAHKKNIEKLADAMVAEGIDQGGKFRVFLNDPQTPVVELTDDDLLPDEPSSMDANSRARDVVNTIEGRYLDGLNKFQGIDFPFVQVADYVDADGEVIIGTWNQELELSEERAQRKALSYMNRLRRTFELDESFGVKAKDVKPGDWVTRKSTLRGFPSGKTFVADEVTKTRDGAVELTLLEVDENEKAWIKEDAQLFAVAEDDPLTANQQIPIPSVTVTWVTIASGGVVMPAFNFAHADYADFVGDEIICEYGVSNGLVGASLGIDGTSRFFTFPGTEENIVALSGIEPGTDFAFRFITREGLRFSDWSDFQEETSSSDFEALAAGIADGIVDQGTGATSDSLSDMNADDAAALDASALNARRLTAQSEVGWNLNQWAGLVSDASRGDVLQGVNSNSILRTRDPIKIGPEDTWIMRVRVYGLSSTDASDPTVRYGFDSLDASGATVQSNVQTGAGLSVLPVGSEVVRTIAYCGADVTETFDVTQQFTVDTDSGAVSFHPQIRDWNANATIQVLEITLSGPHRWGATASESEARTSDGVAGGIEDQGNLATGNMYYQSGYPSSPSNGDFWGKPNDALYYRDSGSWEKIASLGGGFTAIAANDFVESDGNIDYHNFAIPSVTPSGAVGSVSTSRSILIGSSSKWSISGSTLILNNADTGENSAVVRVTLTDAATGEKSSVDIGFSYYYY